MGKAKKTLTADGQLLASTLPGAYLGGASDAFRPGEVVCQGRFEVLGRVGAGGMGVVYAAQDRRLGTTVAVKTLRRASADAVQRFKGEFRALAGVAHPNLVTLYALAEDRGRWMFSMELVRGMPFDAWTRPGGVLDAGRLRDGLAQLADAIAAVHRAGLLHRDIKPSNVLVTPSGRVVVLDLGLAVPREPATGAVSDSDTILLGTPGYMAPEQVEQRSSGAEVDWYALGVLLFECLTGDLPFVGSIGAVLEDKRLSAAPRVRDLVPDAPADLASLADGLLHRDPNLRAGEAQVRETVGPPPPREALASYPPARNEQAFVGRDTELARLSEAFEAARGEASVLVCLAGMSGIGKSALLTALGRQLEDERFAVVLHGRCHEREVIPFNAFDSLAETLSQHLCGTADAEVEALLPGRIWALARMFPALQRVPAIARAPEPPPDAPREARSHALAAFATLLRRLGERRPLAILLDDMQWCDADSAQLLAELYRRRLLPPVAWVLSYRAEAAQAPALLTVREAAATAGVHPLEVSLSPLDDREGQALAHALLRPGTATPRPDRADELLVKLITQEAGGSPLFIGEMARYVVNDQPREQTPLSSLSLASVLRARQRLLSRPARALLEVLSADDRPLFAALATRAAGLRPEQASALEELRAGRFVKQSVGDDPGLLDLYHDRIRETVRHQLLPERARGIHGALAAEMQRQPDLEPERVGYHLEAAGDVRAAAGFKLVAARRALQQLAFERAVDLLDSPLARGDFDPETAPDATVLLAEALSSCGRGHRAADMFQRASRLLPERGVELRLLAARSLALSGYTDQGLGLVEELLTEFSILRDEGWRRLVPLPLRLRAVLARLRVQVRPLEQIDPRDRLEMDLLSLCNSGYSMIDQRIASGYALRLIRMAERTGYATRAARILAMVSCYVGALGKPELAALSIDRAESVLRQALEAGCYSEEEIGLTRAEIAQDAGICAVFASDFETALARLQQALELHHQTAGRQTFLIATCQSFCGWAYFMRGQFDALARTIEAPIETAERSADVYTAVTLRSGTGVTATLATGDALAARQQVAVARSQWPAADYDLQRCYMHLAETFVDFFEGAFELAWEREQREADAYRAAGTTRSSALMQGFHYYHHGLAAAAVAWAEPQHRSKPLLAIAERDRRRLSQLPLRWARPHALILRAALQVARTRDLGTVRAPLSEALRDYDALGMTAYAAAIRAHLSRFDGQAGQPALHDAYQLLRQAGVVAPEPMVRMLVPIRPLLPPDR